MMPAPGGTGFADADLLALRPKMMRVARKLVRCPDVAEDMVQDAIVRALARPDGFTAGTDLGAWLATIVRNGCISHLRSARRHQRLGLAAMPDDADALGLYSTAPPQDAIVDLARHGAALAAMQSAHSWMLVATAMGVEQHEIAAAAGVPLGTVKSRVARLRLALRRAVEPPAEREAA